MASVLSAPSATDWLVGGGELGELIRSRDWASTPIGPVERWPQSLRSAVSILLPSRAQICLFWGPELVTIYNDAYRPTMGIKHPWALGQSGRKVFSEVWDVLRPLLEGVLQRGEAFWASDYPFYLERRGYPEETYFDISYDPVRDETGGVGGVFCIVSDTTGRVVGERRLKTLRELGRRTMQAQTVAEVYAQAASVLGAADKDVPFAMLYEWDGERRGAHRMAVAGISPSSIAAPLVITADGESPWPIEPVANAADIVLEGKALAALGPLPGGSWPEPALHVAVLPIAMPAQAPFGFLVAGASPRLEFDEAYRDYLRLLASAISSALANALALETERKRVAALAQLDRAKTAFFSNVSHEFRTPLTLLLGPLEEELARAPDLPEPSRRRMEMAHRNAIRLLKLVNTLLDFSRIEAGRVQARYEPMDLCAFTAELASNFRSACDRAGLELVVRCTELPQPVHVDRDMWEKVVLNLVSNAFKFTFEGRIEVEMGLADGRPRLVVRDTGIGISPEELPRIFDRFHRVEGVRARTHEGSGIGLALVQELVRMHGGEIGVESEPGRGSTFTVTLRFGVEHLPADRVQARLANRSGSTGAAAAFVEEALAWLGEGKPPELDAPLLGAPAQAEAERILVVDDNADMREYIARLLTTRWRIATAVDGADALETLEREPFDLVVTDVMMPRVDGFELVRRLRQDSRFALLPVLMVSARAGEEARIEGLEAGADDYLVKPFGARELTAQVKSLLAILRARRAAAKERELLLESERAARKEAQLQREHLYSLFMQAPNPIAILRGPEHVVDLANPPMCAIWGRTREEAVGRPILDVLPDVRDQVFPHLLDDVLRTGAPYVGKEARFVRTMGTTRTEFFMNFVYSPLRAVDGRIEGILVIAFDVTEEVRARRSIDDLRARAEEANRTKDQFLAMLGHELRNPLSPIVSALHLLRMRGVAGPEVDILERQSLHLTRMVDDLLDVSRITRGKVDLRRRPIEAAEVVEKAMETAQPMIESGRHPVEVQAPGEGLCIDVDPDRMAQAISNLLTNAAKYSEHGTPIAIRAEAVEGRARISVEDRGVGIEPGMIDTVFDLFVQQPQTIARSGGGLGLGLAIVRNLVEMHGGSVSAKSNGVGRGSVFTIDLPLATRRAQPPVVRETIARERPIAKPRRILVVDDNFDAAATLVEVLRLRGHTVQVAHDALGALGTAAGFDAEIALIDIGLPDLDGYELAKRLRGLHGERKPTLVAVTGYGLEADRRRASEAGFDHHFVKPIDIERLGDMIGTME